MSRRVNTEARELILQKAFELFNSEGFEAVSMERVAEVAGMKKATVFYYYPNKQVLGKAVIAAAAKRYAERLRVLFADESSDPEKTVRSLFDLEVAQQKRDCERGCFIGKMGQELGESNPDMRQSISSCMSQWRQEVAAYLDSWHKRGYFRAGFRSMEAADGILALYEGGVLIARVMGEEAPVEHARRTAVRVVVSWRS